MTTDLLSYEASGQIEQALVDGLPNEQLQMILDIIYGNNMFKVIDDEDFGRKVKEKKDELYKRTLNNSDLGFLKRGLASRNHII